MPLSYPPPPFLIGFGRIRKLASVRNGGDESPPVHPVAPPHECAHNLLKIHKTFDNLPPFRPITDTTGTAYQPLAKFLTKLLNPLTTNEFNVKDSFDAVSHINNIPCNLLDEGYRFDSLLMSPRFSLTYHSKNCQHNLEKYLILKSNFVSTTLQLV